MKARLLLIFAVVPLLIITSCGGDDSSDPPPHIVGTWELDSYIMTNLPNGFSNFEGRIFQISEITFGSLGAFETYTLDIMANGTYNRKIEVIGPSLVDDGTWTSTEESLILNSEDEDEDEVWNIDKDEDDQLWINSEAQFSLLEDAIADTLTSEYANSLTDEEFSALFTAVSLDLVYAFEK